MTDQTTNPRVVLVVEDEPLQRMNMADMLEEAGFHAIEAGNARQAMLLLESRSDIAVIVSDIDMPPGMNGMELVAIVHDKWPPIALILLSGNVDRADVRLPEGGVFISKPYRPVELIETLNRLAA